MDCNWKLVELQEDIGMKYVVAYDVADDRRRTRLVGVLLNYGTRIQESVFFADLEAGLYGEMLEKVGRVVEISEDVVHVFPVCAGCLEGKVILGNGRVPEYREFYIV